MAAKLPLIPDHITVVMSAGAKAASWSATLLDVAPKVIAVVAIVAAAVGATIQYVLNSRGEQRQRQLANLQTDIEVSKVFSELIEIANGYRGFSEPQDKIIELMSKEMPAGMIGQIMSMDPRRIGTIFSGAIVPESTPLARQLAAAESIASLAIKYPILLEPALIGLDVTVGLSPLAKHAYDRLAKHYDLDRPLTQWGQDWSGYHTAAVGQARG